MAREQHVAKLQARQSEIPRKVAVRLVRGEGRGVSDLYGVEDAACPLSTRGGRGWVAAEGRCARPPFSPDTFEQGEVQRAAGGARVCCARAC